MSRSANFFLLIIAPCLSLALSLLGLETLKQNLTGWFLLAVGIAYPVVAIASYCIHKTPLWSIKEPVLQSERNDRSFWYIVPGMVAAFFIPPLEYMYLPAWLPRFAGLDSVGLGLTLAGSALGFWARCTLQGYYSGHLQITSGQQFIMAGPYRWIRHPSYGGFILVVLGIAVGYGSLLGFLAVLLFLFPAMIYRIHVEENLLENQFGDPYLEYRKRVKKLIPGIW